MDNNYDERVFQVNMEKCLIFQFMSSPCLSWNLLEPHPHIYPQWSTWIECTIAGERQFPPSESWRRKKRRHPPDLPCLIFTLGTSYKFLGFIICCQRTDKRTYISFTLIFAFDQESAFFSVQCQLFTLVASGRSSTIHLNSSMQLFWSKYGRLPHLGSPSPHLAMCKSFKWKASLKGRAV